MSDGLYAMSDLLPQVQTYILEKQTPIPGWRAGEEERLSFQAVVAQALVKLRLDRQIGADGRLQEVAARLAGMMTGVGILQPLLAEDADSLSPGVEEIVVRQGFVQVEQRGRIEDVGALAGDDHFEQVARRAADLGQRVLKGNRPYVLVDLPDGSRFTAIVPPLSVRGVAINVRVFARRALSLADLAEMGAFDKAQGGTFDKLRDEADSPSPAAAASSDRLAQDASAGGLDVLPPAARLLAAVAAGNLATVLVSGEFGSGKTTLLNAMSLYVPPHVQLAVAETFEELRVAHPHPLRVVVPEGRPDFPSLDEVLNVVVTRMRPDLLIVGEIVRDEAARFLDAINLGKKAWSTIHGNDALGALYRLETKALASGLPHQAIREQIAAGVDLIVHLRKDPRSGRRYVAQVARVRGLDTQGKYHLETLYDAGDSGATALESLYEEA
jgi:pilus assembly protein CpaF